MKFELEDMFKREAIIKVIGIGGGGGNAVDHMVNTGISGVDFIGANTDAQALRRLSVDTLIQLGSELTQGLGAGTNPDIGKQAAQEDRGRIEEAIDGADMVFLTAGMGGDWISDVSDPALPGPGTDMIGPEERLAHIKECLPEICSLDCGTLNFGDSSVITVNTPNDLRKAAKRLQEIKVKPEIEAFDLGNMWFGAQLYKEGLLSDPPMFQMCLGIPWGAPATTLAMQAMKDIMPKEGIWSGFAISKNEMPFVAQTVLMGGNPRVGLEDNLYLSKGKLATNAQLVEKAVRIIDELGYTPMTPAETREKLKLVKHK